VSSHGGCGEVRLELAVYVLGALGPGDRSVVDRHLADCADCRYELAGLAGLPALLHRVAPAEASALASDDAGTGRRADLPTGLRLQRLLTGASRDRRRHVRSRVAVAAAAGLVAGASAIAGWRTAEPAGRRPAPAAPAWAASASGDSPRTGVSATVRYTTRAWGLELNVKVAGVALGTSCELDVISRQGRVTAAGGWTIVRGQGRWYPAASPVPVADIRGFAVASGHRILVSVPVPAHRGASVATRSEKS
jgi:Putative zinc-finger